MAPPQKRRRLSVDDSRIESGSQKWQDTLEKCLPMVFPYVALTDLVILLQSCPILGPLVGEFLDSGTHIRIDEKFVDKFPIDDNEDLYDRLAAKKSSLTVSGLNIDQVDALKTPFQNITRMTLEKVKEIDEDYLNLPPNITSLKLSHCEVDDSTLTDILDFCSPRSIHLDHVTITSADGEGYYATWTSYGNAFLDQIEHITIEHCGGEFDFSHVTNLGSITIRCENNLFWLPSANLRRLDVEFGDCYEHCSQSTREMPKLEYLSIRGEEPEEIYKDMVFGESLTTFECHNAPIKIDKILQMKSLKHANVHCNWYHADQLREHFSSLESMESFTVTCCAPTPGYDPIRSLNEDCLREIIAYVETHEIFADPVRKLLGIHPKFAQFLSILTINQDILQGWPALANVQFYEQLGENVKNLGLWVRTEEQVYELIQYFPTLRKLGLGGVKLTDASKVALFPLVVELRISTNDTMTKAFATELFRRLNETLLRLELQLDSDSASDWEGIQELSNLRELNICCDKYVDYIYWVDGLPRLLKRNTRLAKLCVTGICSSYIGSMLVEINAESLRSLNIWQVDMSFHIDIKEAIGRFFNLEELYIGKCKVSANDVKYLSRGKLKTLDISGQTTNEVALEIVKQVPTLKKFILNDRISTQRKAFEALLESYLKTNGKVFELKEKKDSDDERGIKGTWILTFN